MLYTIMSNRKWTFCFLILLFCTPILAQAAPTPPASNPTAWWAPAPVCPDSSVSNKFFEPGCDIAHNLERLYANAVPILLWLIILMVIIAGYVYITSGGSAERVKLAKDILGTTMIGAVLLILMPLILDALGLGPTP